MRSPFAGPAMNGRGRYAGAARGLGGREALGVLEGEDLEARLRTPLKPAEYRDPREERYVQLQPALQEPDTVLELLDPGERGERHISILVEPGSQPSRTLPATLAPTPKRCLTAAAMATTSAVSTEGRSSRDGLPLTMAASSILLICIRCPFRAGLAAGAGAASGLAGAPGSPDEFLG